MTSAFIIKALRGARALRLFCTRSAFPPDESFIVSLTLALGLSKMASRKVRVDSLFLNEGFGTLDEEALETALETLSGLQQDGKLIGMSSHVSALKEKIGTQINIIPVSGGRSSLSGPGCTKVVKSK